VQGSQNGGRSCADRAPRVSVIVLNFNGEKIIAKCLDHLLAQSYRDFEIVVVDNASADNSVAIAGRYFASGRLSIIRAGRNLGVAGGRNLGMRHSEGRIFAFIDNDGYADRDWLAEAVRVLDSGPEIGAVAPMVFFQNNKAVLNGAGGMMNRQGYATDWCFDTPYEFAQLRGRVLYAMGCGMVIRREIFDRFGGFDPKLFRYFDDTELGIRIWRAGMQVAVAPRSWIDHEFNYSSNFLSHRALAFERARLRVAFTHYPLRHLPAWLCRECVLLARLDLPIDIILLRAWLWNLLRLPSAVARRLKFSFARNPLWELMEPSWGQFGPNGPDNRANRPDPSQARPILQMDGENDVRQLNFGWYNLEADGAIRFRWSAARASALFSLRAAALTCSLTVGGPNNREARVKVRPLGMFDPCLEKSVKLPASGWASCTFPAHLPAGNYELLLCCDDGHVDPAGRRLGVAVSSIRFE
jgi:GT2 family glycosyltransferase